MQDREAEFSKLSPPMTPILCTGFAFRFGHRKWNRGRNRLPKLVQTNAPSVPFPVFKSEGKPGICLVISLIHRFKTIFTHLRPKVTRKMQMAMASLAYHLQSESHTFSFIENSKGSAER